MSETNNGIEVLAATGSGQAMMAPGGGLSGGKLALADAETGDVLAGKTYYAGGKELKTGTLALANATATAADVASGKTFYAGDKELKTGTFTLQNVAVKLSGTFAYTRFGDDYRGGSLSLSAKRSNNNTIVVSATVAIRDKDGYTEPGTARTLTCTITL